LKNVTTYRVWFETVGWSVWYGENQGFSAAGPGALIENHVFINRGVTIGHDTHIQSFTRIQPGCNIGGLTNIGRSVSIGISATIIDRIVVGNHSLLAAGSVLLNDLPSKMMAAGSPAIVKKHL
jgi:acetyltransferase-like isoleucine patch superfamily enzyme